MISINIYKFKLETLLKRKKKKKKKKRQKNDLI